MPKRPLTPSRGRPSKKNGRSISSSRKVQSPRKKLSSSLIEKSPSKRKSRSNSRSRKVNAASVTVNHYESTFTRPGSPRLHATAIKSNSKDLSTTSAPALSPPVLRSRTLGAALAQQMESQKHENDAPSTKYYKLAIKEDNVVSRQLIKFGTTIKQTSQKLLRSAMGLLWSSWKKWLLTFALLLLFGLVFKFHRELLINVHKINRQMGEFIQQQYEQQRKIWQMVSDPLISGS